ncbi:MAG TPA: flagellar hook-associated protein 2 [Bacillales bacterium]|nr:flagellar hook-associated protein 2 [Bacillales bacterium]
MVDSIRFSGLASGMDTQAIVDSMMRASRLPLDRLQQQKQVLEWKRDDYREMNTALKNFDTFLFDNIYKQSKMLAKTVTSSNESVATATANAQAANNTFELKDVTLAKAAQRTSGSPISVNSANKIDPSKSLWSQRAKFAKSITWQQEHKSEDFTVPKGGGSAINLQNKAISDVEDIKVYDTEGNLVKTYAVTYDTPPNPSDPDTAYVNQETGQITFGGDKLTEDYTFKVNYKNNFLEFNAETFNEDGTQNSIAFKVDGTTSLNRMLSDINNSNAGINIFYDSGSDKVVATRKETGNFTDGTEINFTGASSGFFMGEDSNLQLNSEIAGADATFTINGLQTSRKSNTFTINDVTISLKRNISGDESVTISTKNDADSTYNSIKEFVDKYNELLDKMNGKLTEERYRSFTPLTNEQKGAMKDKEIEQWEEKAKSGLLKRDSLLTSGLGKFRIDLYTEVKVNDVTRTDKDYNQLAEIGIKTTKNYLDRGKIEIDELKLKEAIEKNPEAVYQLFMADGPTYGEQGLARRLRKSIDETMLKVEEKAGNIYKTEQGYSMGKDLVRINSDINSWEERLKQIEQRYWNQFNAMEKAMQQMNNQSNQLMAQLGSMQQR